MTTILVLSTAILLFSLGLAYSICAIRRKRAKERLHAALFAQLDSMERSFDASNREYQREQREYRRQIRKSQSPDPSDAPKKPTRARIKSPSSPSGPSGNSNQSLPEPVALIAPKPRINLVTVCTHLIRTTASYAISLLRPLFQLPRTFTSFFTRPPTPRPTPTIDPSPQNHIA